MIYKLRQKIKAGLPAGKAGFTLIETLLAVLILAVALTGPLTIAAKALSSALIAKDQVTAFFLAQDAVEYIRFKRDTNALSAASWLSGLDACLGATGCNVDSIQNTTPTTCPTSGCTALNYDLTQSFYTPAASVNADTIVSTPNSATPAFTRTVTLAPVLGNPNEENLTVAVRWKDAGSVTRSVVVRENITNWQ